MTQGAAEDLWHLSIDDLFVHPVETPPLEGPGPFVINLSASTAPISFPASGLPGFEKLKLYQLSRKEDGRDRFRLRLGFFETPQAANEALAALRERYPSAFAANAAQEDLRLYAPRSEPAPRAEPVTTAPAARAAPVSPQVRGGGVRNDTGRRPHKKRDIRRDHGPAARAGEPHGHQRSKPAGRPAQHAAHSSAPASVSKGPVIEDIDVEAILLAALEPAPTSKSPQRNAPRAATQAKHSRAQTRVESKPKPAAPRPAAKHEARSPKPAAMPTPAPAPEPAVSPAAAPLMVPASTKASVPAAVRANTEPTANTSTQTAVAAAPSVSPPAAAVPTVVDAPAAAAPPKSTEAAASPVQVPERAPEPVAPATVDGSSSPKPAPVDDEAHIVTHPRLDEPAMQAGEPQAKDIPIDLHLIDRIFEDETPEQPLSEDDTPTVEVLALQSPQTPPATEAKSEPAVEQKDATPVLQPAATAEAPQPTPSAETARQTPRVEALQVAPSEPAAAPAVKEARAIKPHDILALLTQPIPVARSLVRAMRSRAGRSAPEPKREAPPASAVLPEVETLAPPVPQTLESVSGTGSNAPSEVRVDETPGPEVVLELAPEPPPPVSEAATPQAPLVAPAVSTAPIAPPPAAVAVVDASVKTMAVQIESQLEAVMALELDVTGQPLALAPSASVPAESAVQPPPVKLELELELAPEPENLPVLIDIVEEVTVTEVIVPRREPQPTSAPQGSTAAPAPTIAPPQAPAVQPASMSASPATRPPASHGSRVSVRPPDVKANVTVPAPSKLPAVAVNDAQAPPAKPELKLTPEPKPAAQELKLAPPAPKAAVPGTTKTAKPETRAATPEPKPAKAEPTPPVTAAAIKAPPPARVEAKASEARRLDQKYSEAKRVEAKPPEPKRVVPEAPAAARVEPKPRPNHPNESRPRPPNEGKRSHGSAPSATKAHPTSPVYQAKIPAAPPPEAGPKRPVVIFDAPVEDMDSTQTLRALTPLELSDDTQSKWFAVQLSLSEEQVKVESLPHIDIFDEYRLYSVAGVDQGRFLHSLRLGFFSSETSAQFVAGYLRTYFDEAVIKRVSIAEHDRFAERKEKTEKPANAQAPTEAKPAGSAGSVGDSGSNPRPVHGVRKSVDSSPTGRHKTLGDELYEEARQVALSQSAIRRLPKNSSLWSRLFGQDKD